MDSSSSSNTQAAIPRNPCLQEIEIIAADCFETSHSGTALTVNDFVAAGSNSPRCQHPDNYIYVFKEPAALGHLLDACSQPESSPFASIRHIRVYILSPLSTLSLTELELNGGIDGPNISSLVASWREIFRKIPANNAIQTIEFDMSCPGQSIELREIVRLLQHISTVVNLRSQQTKTIRCSVRECGSEEKRVWLEKSLVGREESSH